MTTRVWSVRDALGWTVDYLERKGIEQPRLSAEWLLSSATGLSRIELYAYHDRPLGEVERANLREGVKARGAGAPLQYVTGEMPFRHIVVRVRPGVFIPRPETEILVEQVLVAIASIDSPVVVDLCTGSGCAACSIAHERPDARVVATDLSPVAVEVARDNAGRLGIADRVTVYEGDLFAPLPRDLVGQIDAVVANPPYVPTADLPELPAEILGYEPSLALDGGPDGLDLARRIMSDAREWLVPGHGLFMELDETRVSDAVIEMQAWYEHCRTVEDLAGRSRVAAGCLR
ncbi:MAG: peptide chain release factor N(5)-glutamine methyltransferase [Actinomycetota bacterium]|nr:peptide chain release factor N(5)-glutamine methyltransferase [Actinomycetota bacterium]